MFEFFINAFNLVLYQPLLSALLIIYRYLPIQDFGLAVIVLTIITKLIFYPLGTKGIKAQKALQDLQPKIKEVQDKFKNDKTRQAKEMMELYKREGVSPLSGCLPLLIQFPILIALYRVFWKGIAEQSGINHFFLGFVDLSIPSWPLALATGVLQYIQTRMSVPKNKAQDQGAKNDFSNVLQKQMLYFFPVFTVIILLRLPSALALYWLTTIIFTIFQQWLIYKR
ncbi:MAG: membrane protein insertase YidC [Candidatus Nealsonbacteria bacterium]|nr:membrane protein insertase YidC [Candidatus Nealsonbacteria bacterium]